MAVNDKYRVWFIVLISWITFSGFTVPENNLKNMNQTLFTIGRSKDANEIWYTLNTNVYGDLNLIDSVKIFWLKKAENNLIEPLTWIQKRYSYGIQMLETEKTGRSVWKFQFVSYDKRTFELRQISESKYKVFANTAGKEIEVSRIFIQIDGGSFWLPKISYVKLYGLDAQSGNQIIETLIPANNTSSENNSLISYIAEKE